MVFKLLKCFRPSSLLLKWVLTLNASQINQSKGTDHMNSGTFPATSPTSRQVWKHMLCLRRRSLSHGLQAPLSCVYILYASGLVSLEEDPSFIGGPSSEWCLDWKRFTVLSERASAEAEACFSQQQQSWQKAPPVCKQRWSKASAHTRSSDFWRIADFSTHDWT